MPDTTSYPGVYVENIASGVHTITGAPTSIATFVGWAAQGPVSYASLVLSWSDFQRTYGGFDARSPFLAAAVSQFFSNGGHQAYVLRLVYTGKADTTHAPAASATLKLGGLTFTAGTVGPDGKLTNAANPGVWAQNYGIAIRNQAGRTNRFQVEVVYTAQGANAEVVVESYANLSITSPDPAGRHIADVINKQSSFVTVDVQSNTSTPPPDTPSPSPKLAGAATDDGTVLQPSTSTSNAGDFERALSAVTGILDQIDLFNLLCVPGEIVTATITTLEQYCEGRRAFLIADSDPGITNPANLKGPPGSGTNAAFYFPWVQAPDPLNQFRPAFYPPCGFVAGIYARTDATRGVWKAPAGTAATLAGASGVMVPLNDGQTGLLNPLAVNCIRSIGGSGIVVWGARTTAGNDQLGSEWKYIPVRRTALFIEESLYRALRWAVFEPNADPLWAELRLSVGSFMHILFQQGAFQGHTPADAYFVKCDGETTTQNDIDLGIVNILVGFAPLKPAEFVEIHIQLMAGKIAP